MTEPSMNRNPGEPPENLGPKQVWVGHHNGMVLCDLPSNVGRLHAALSPSEARGLAHALLRHAEKAEPVN